MDDSKKSFLAVFIIILSLILIILPPVFRKVYKNESNKIIDVKNGKLVCFKKNIDKFNIKITNEYKNGKVENIKLVFTDNSNNNGESFISSESRTLMDYYMSLNDSDYYVENNDTNIILEKNVKDNYKDDETIKKMFSSYNKAKKYYEDNNYTCK